ncbi:MAG: hypothetical protein ACRBFS_22770 [Aureispira sp.]
MLFLVIGGFGSSGILLFVFNSGLEIGLLGPITIFLGFLWAGTAPNVEEDNKNKEEDWHKDILDV